MKKIEGAVSDGEAYESNQSEGIYTAGIDLPFRPESIFSRSMDKVWSSRIECHGESKEDAEELRDAVLALITAPQPVQGEVVWYVNMDLAIRAISAALRSQRAGKVIDDAEPAEVLGGAPTGIRALLHKHFPKKYLPPKPDLPRLLWTGVVDFSTY